MLAASLESPFWRTHKELEPRFVRPELEFANCPVEASLGVLGKKWTIVILRDIGVYRVDRFHRLRETLPGISQKVLGARLKELEREGFLRRTVEKSQPPKVVRWSLTEKGYDAIRIGMMLGAFGSKWHAARVFPDGRPRGLEELYTPEGLELLVGESDAGSEPSPAKLTKKFASAT